MIKYNYDNNIIHGLETNYASMTKTKEELINIIQFDEELKQFTQTYREHLDKDEPYKDHDGNIQSLKWWKHRFPWIVPAVYYDNRIADEENGTINNEVCLDYDDIASDNPYETNKKLKNEHRHPTWNTVVDSSGTYQKESGTTKIKIMIALPECSDIEDYKRKAQNVAKQTDAYINSLGYRKLDGSAVKHDKTLNPSHKQSFCYDKEVFYNPNAPQAIIIEDYTQQNERITHKHNDVFSYVDYSYEFLSDLLSVPEFGKYFLNTKDYDKHWRFMAVCGRDIHNKREDTLDLLLKMAEDYYDKWNSRDTYKSMTYDFNRDTNQPPQNWTKGSILSFVNELYNNVGLTFQMKLTSIVNKHQGNKNKTDIIINNNWKINEEDNHYRRMKRNQIDLLAEVELPPWLIYNLLRRDEIINIAAPFRQGKSSVTTQLIYYLSVMADNESLKRIFRGDKIRVWILDERDMTTIKKDIIRSVGNVEDYVNSTNIMYNDIDDESFWLYEQEQLDSALISALNEGEHCDLLIVDTFRRFMNNGLKDKDSRNWEYIRKFQNMIKNYNNYVRKHYDVDKLLGVIVLSHAPISGGQYSNGGNAMNTNIKNDAYVEKNDEERYLKLTKHRGGESENPEVDEVWHFPYLKKNTNPFTEYLKQYPRARWIANKLPQQKDNIFFADDIFEQITKSGHNVKKESTIRDDIDGLVSQNPEKYRTGLKQKDGKGQNKKYIELIEQDKKGA